MKAVREVQPQSLLEINRQTAVTRLRAHLNTPEERALHAAPGREHQGDVMDGTLGFLEKGGTAGYIELPTGGGKTVIAAALIRALRMNTIVVSPTKTIKDKTKATIEQINPDMSVTDFDGRSQSVAGNVINTTPNSLGKLADIGAVAMGTELIIVDEIDEGMLGEQRHKLLKRFPNALIVGLTATPDDSKLDSLEERGLVDASERWTGAFRNRICRMTREELQERGALTPVDIYLLKTNNVVGDIHVAGGGKIKQAAVDRYLNRKSRNFLAIAAIVGLESLPPGVEIAEDLRNDIAEIHEAVKGKRTIIFGLNIKHIQSLAETLRSFGITAAAVHGKMKKDDQDIIMAAHQKDPRRRGSVQVVLTDQL